MFDKITLFDRSAAMARHAGAAQAQIARNIAHADTPGYAARRLAPFSTTLDQPTGVEMKATRVLHLSGDSPTNTARLVDSGTEPAPNGNTVSLEEELFASAQAGSSHRRALAIYRHAMTVIRTTISR